MKIYGEDEYGRYVEIDGERYVIEPYPFKWHPVLKMSAWWEMLKWKLFHERWFKNVR